MQATQRMRRTVNPLVVVAVLLGAMVVSGAAGYLIRSGLPQAQSQSQAPAEVSGVPAWAHQGTGPTDADTDLGAALPSMCTLVCTSDELAGENPYALAQGWAADSERLAAQSRSGSHGGEAEKAWPWVSDS